MFRKVESPVQSKPRQPSAAPARELDLHLVHRKQKLKEDWDFLL